MKRIISILLALSLLAVSSAFAAADTNDTRVGGILAYVEKNAGADSVQALADGFITENAGGLGTWYVISLIQAGYSADFSTYKQALDTYVAQNSSLNATTRQKLALAYTILGVSNEFVQDTLDNTIGALGVMSYIYGLHLLNNGLVSEAFTREDAVNALLSMQCGDGGWKVTGTVSDTDVTAMALQALAPLYETNADVRTAADKAIELLSSMQLNNGGYRSYGTENAESCAQVLTALCALNIDPEQDARFIKNGCSVVDALASYKTAEGGYSHVAGGEVNQLATVQTFYSFIALERMRAGYGSLYDFSRHGSVQENKTSKNTTGYKPIACAVILGMLAVAVILLIVFKKRHAANFIFAFIAAGVLIAFILLTDFQSADSYYGAATVKTGTSGSVSLQIDCGLLVDNGYRSEYIPSDGIILPVTCFMITDGETVYDVLVEACRQYGIQMDHSGSGSYVYVSGIGYLYELQYGDLSGWVYTVNGEMASVGCGEYTLKDGDIIRWQYTLDLGNDVT